MSMLGTPDPEGAERFYGALFGWETESFDTGNGAVTLWRLPGYVGGEPEQPVARDVVAAMTTRQDPAPPHWGVDFWVHDVDEAARATAARGGAVLAEPHDVPGFRQATLADPQGAVFTVSRLRL
jgi:predicted enzyme related to lactoylglutathione lyase